MATEIHKKTYGCLPAEYISIETDPFTAYIQAAMAQYFTLQSTGIIYKTDVYFIITVATNR
jgi:hypothetical protein